MPAQVFNPAFSRQAVIWLESTDLLKESLTTAEKILKKTKTYSPYLDLETRFAIYNTEEVLGRKVLPATAEGGVFW